MAVSCKHCVQRCANVVDADLVGIDLDEKCEMLTTITAAATATRTTTAAKNLPSYLSQALVIR